MTYDHTELKKQFDKEYANDNRAIDNWEFLFYNAWTKFIDNQKPIWSSRIQYRRNPKAPLLTTPHIHAAEMLLYAKDCQINDCAWKNWQVNSSTGWVDCVGQPNWYITSVYRRKSEKFVLTIEDQINYCKLVQFCLRNEGDSYRILFSSLSQQSMDYYTSNIKDPYSLFPDAFSKVVK